MLVAHRSVLKLQDFAGLYGKVVFAGTFDHLHEGHKHLLRTASKLGKKVAIGLTSDSMLDTKPKKHLVQNYAERHRELEAFLKEESIIERCSIFQIDTVEGGADRMDDLEALIVSDEIKVVRNAFEINDKRIRNGLNRFHIIVIPRVRTPDGRPLSSSRIRDGEDINSDVLVY
ncbi:MAG: pantetheine-phosphate adenylyltransferase [Candidatus Thorarchaeota archaeon]